MCGTGKPVLLVDVDTTLFNTAEFWDDFVATVRTVAGPALHALPLSRDTFTKGFGRLRYTNYSGILSTFNVTHEAVKSTLKQVGRSNEYVFDDANRWLDTYPDMFAEWDVRLLTCGTKKYQQLKLQTHPVLATMACDFVTTAKADHIAAAFGARRGVLVDDKPGQRLPPGWCEVRIDRFGIRPPDSEHAIVTSMGDVTHDLLMSLLDQQCTC